MVEENVCVKFISDEKVNGMKLFRDFGNNWLLTDCTEQYGRFRFKTKREKEDAFGNPTSHWDVPPGIKWKNPDDIWNQLVMWPSEDERKELFQVMQLEGFTKCIGFVNGTTIPLNQKPALNGNVYFDC
ncbi:hypothetical protein BY996DRAFT_6545954 [Phakopsora pachyrhizi]|uniref:Uncharacterized protein n=1 Tax=Phakopsora pachyrhizi TaxID=170000 RepID=A0AAV0AF99_PHAPC|nr:hypothetical protein BY996DRAFT_6545954 [Phakopsora pachyrhizi]CAH7666787.1 hypothetical protein PPACK8108_LOCUS1138 [Phakopsora pachyrhizi]